MLRGINKKLQQPIYIVDDDKDDLFFVKNSFEKFSEIVNLKTFTNGRDLINDLIKAEVEPVFILLDLNMPIMDGKEVLIWLKDHQEFSHIPTMIFTTSSREEDVKLCQKHDCTFFRKPTLYRDLLHIVQVMMQMCDRAARV